MKWTFLVQFQLATIVLMLRVLTLVILLFGITIAYTPVQAQTPIFTSTSPDFLALQEKYFADLSKYREKEETFKVTRAQYYQLNTLASQELVLKDARELLILRAEVLQTYLQMLQIILDETTGVPLEQKASLNVAMSQSIDQLSLHRNDVAQVQNRADMDKESEEFIDLFEDISELSYTALSYVKLGRVQTTLDKLRNIRDKVKEEVYNRTLTPNQISQKDRGFSEINGLIDTTSNKISIAEERVRKGMTNDLSGYTNLNQFLSPIFGQINQTIEFLHEIR